MTLADRYGLPVTTSSAVAVERYQDGMDNLLAYGLDVVLRLLHPFAPFVTETVWQELLWTKSNLITEHWPKVIHKPSTAIAKRFELEIIEILAAKQKETDKVASAKLQKDLGWQPRHSFEEGFAQMVNWFQDNAALWPHYS